MSNVVGIIPARMGSSRFPGKPLARIHGLTMIEHVYRRACMSRALDAVAIATCDEAIAIEAERFGATAIMTSDKHERGTDRVAEAATKLEADIVVNVQGDEPMLDPRMLDLAVEPLLSDASVHVTNLIVALPLTRDAIEDPNGVKVVTDRRMDAMYFSRSVVPGLRYAPVEHQRYRQLGLYAFRAPLLQEFTRLPPTPLEAAESVDMMRLLEHGHKIRCVLSPYQVQSVDTPEELKLVERLLVDDPLLPKYVEEWRG